MFWRTREPDRHHHFPSEGLDGDLFADPLAGGRVLCDRVLDPAGTRRHDGADVWRCRGRGCLLGMMVMMVWMSGSLFGGGRGGGGLDFGKTVLSGLPQGGGRGGTGSFLCGGGPWAGAVDSVCSHTSDAREIEKSQRRHFVCRLWVSCCERKDCCFLFWGVKRGQERSRGQRNKKKQKGLKEKKRKEIKVWIKKGNDCRWWMRIESDQGI